MSTFTSEQMAAAQMILARLAAEAGGLEFDESALGIEFMVMPQPYIAITDEGELISVSDVIMASLSILWTLLDDLSDHQEMDIEELISSMGVRLAFDALA